MGLLFQTLLTRQQSLPKVDKLMLCAALLESRVKVVNIHLATRVTSSRLITGLTGHAIWIGNLPPQTELMDLVHHVCKETDGLESLFLISKSSCAFANFKDEEASIAAQRKLHDSKFMMVKLVSRLRKSTVEGPAGTTAPTGPASSSQLKGPAPNQVATGNTNDTNGDKATVPGVETPPTVAESTPVKLPTVGAGATQKDRFFILKSLTIEDLDLSVQTGIWATQSHNEQTLNDAFNVSTFFLGHCRPVKHYINAKCRWLTVIVT
jgi:YT521-B-like domain